ncbi:MAG: DsrE/DsrF/DrsH-like family protein [Deltaproteobacteria bacterium]|nr:DsrE/DsrF/DrsH-like family protein [Deltaproteobacteria bacterium]
MDNNRTIAIICSKGGLDEVYPALILASGARQGGLDCFIFFTFYGLDAITEAKIDHLHVNMVGNPSSPVPTMLAGLPGMGNFAATMMKKRMVELDLPGAREMVAMLDESGCELYACELAMKMFGLEKGDLVPQVRDVITVSDFYELTEGAQIIFT